jgi:hypothetical protein
MTAPTFRKSSVVIRNIRPLRRCLFRKKKGPQIINHCTVPPALPASYEKQIRSTEDATNISEQRLRFVAVTRITLKFPNTKSLWLPNGTGNYTEHSCVREHSVAYLLYATTVQNTSKANL